MPKKKVNPYQYAPSIPIVLRLFARDSRKEMTMREDIELCDLAETRIRELILEETAPEEQADSLSDPDVKD